MNRLDLRIQRGEEVEAEVVRILIDGRDLIDLVRPIELPFARAEGHPELAGGYDGLLPRDWIDLPEWSYASFGPFVFDRAQYDDEVARVRARAQGTARP
jgi:hypothetical protein